MHHATLCYLLKDGHVLLGLKKRGFGEGRWNGYGGKVERGETPEEATVREVKEENGIAVALDALEKAAVLGFFFTNAPAGKSWDQIVHVYICREWSGEPVETEEMRPRWFAFDDVPISQMWNDDPYWLPLVLDGKKVEGTFTFGHDNSSVIEQRVEIVREFSDS